jgi:predicted signal transduction protein with EAL and GGDEF domain
MMIDARQPEANQRQARTQRRGHRRFDWWRSSFCAWFAPPDLCARVGGDEFAVAMPETEIDRAREVATRLRRAVDQAGLGMPVPEQVEVSVGIAAWSQGQDWQTTYQASDRDLYEDKRRRKTARRWHQEDRPAPAIRILGRGTGRRRVSGA